MIAPNGCGRCSECTQILLHKHHLPKWNFARSRVTGQKICDLCARAEALEVGLGEKESGLTFSMARIAVQNEYEENLRLPKGMGMGIFLLGINKFITDPEVEAEIYGWDRADE